jgi:hypothetical protein
VTTTTTALTYRGDLQTKRCPFVWCERKPRFPQPRCRSWWVTCSSSSEKWSRQAEDAPSVHRELRAFTLPPAGEQRDAYLSYSG